MKKLLYLAIILLGIGFLFSCKGGGQSSNNGVSSVEPANKPIEKDWFIGQWHSLNDPAEVMTINSDVLAEWYEFLQFDNKTKLYVLKDAHDWSSIKDNILTVIELPKGTRFLSGEYENDSFIPDPSNDSHLFRFNEAYLEGETFKIVTEVYERIGYTDESNRYQPTKEDEWLFGKWSSSEGNTIEIKKPNILVLNGEYQEFYVWDDKTAMNAAPPHAQDGDIYYLYPQRKQIVRYGEEVFRKK